MNFEIHVTVESCAVDHFKRYCGDVVAKPLLIDLYKDSSIIGSQLMCSKKISSEYYYGDVIKEALNIAIFFTSKGLIVQRVKIETDYYISTEPAHYYESHIHVEINSAKEMKDLITFLNKVKYLYGDLWYISKNIFNESEEYIITYRNSCFERFLDASQYMREQKSSIRIVKIHNELALLDTNLDLDKGWMY